MNTQDVATKLVELCKKGEHLKAIDTLYAKNIVSVEPMAMKDMPAELSGFEKVKGKSVWWFDNYEVHNQQIEGPFVHGDKFVVMFNMDTTDKASKKRMHMAEAGVYTVHDGKVTHEEFFYAPNPAH